MNKLTMFFSKAADKICFNPKYAAAAAVIFTLMYRLAALTLIDDSGDQKYYMNAARHLFTEDYPLSHWSARFAIVLPVYLGRAITGGTAVGAYLIPVLFSLAAAYLLVKIASLYGKPQAGFAAAVLFALDPLMLRDGCQILPGIFSAVYLLACAYFLLKYTFNQKTASIIAAAAFMFLAYETHFNNMLFMPGMLLILILGSKNFWKPAGIFCGILLAMYAAETILYILFTDLPYGRLSIILSSHLTGNRTLHAIKPYQLISRFVRPGPFFVLAFVLSIVFAVKHIRAKEHRALAIYLPAFSFFAILLFAVKSIEPLVPVIPMDARYAEVGMPFMLVFCCCSIFTGVKPAKIFAGAAGFVCVAACIFGCIRESGHPLPAVIEIDKQIDAAYSLGFPIAFSKADTKAAVWYDVSTDEEKQQTEARRATTKENADEGFHLYEEAGRINKAVDYINAFFANDGETLTKTLSKTSDGNPILVCAPAVLMTTGRSAKDEGPEAYIHTYIHSYVLKNYNPICLAQRRPLRLKFITISDYMRQEEK